MDVVGSPPDVLRWVHRSGDHGDCAVVAISLATGYTYEETLAAAISVHPQTLHDGMSTNAVKKTLAVLGFKSRVRKKRFDVDEDTGLLWLTDPKGDGHMVYLWAGRVINPNNMNHSALWLHTDDYIKEGKWQVDCLITLEGKD